MPRLLILTAGYGEGHNTAARAVQAALREHPGVEADLVDLFDLTAPRLNQLTRRTYLKLINTAPRVWNGVYRWLDRPVAGPLLNRTLIAQRRQLARLLAQHRPDALVSTFPIHGWLLAHLRRQGLATAPLYTVVTDALTINSLWYRAPSDRWFVTDPDSAAWLHHAGIRANDVEVSGFPVALAFADRPAHLIPPDPARPGQPKRILYMINSGRARALETARALLARPGWEITFTAGRDHRLKEELGQLLRATPGRGTVLGWTDRIPDLLMTHHLIISKAGGATTQEAINALCPMIVNQVVPGQEEGNYELLRRHDAGTLAETPEAIVAAVERAFADDAAVWHRWHGNLARLAHPSAARTIARRVLAGCTPPVPQRVAAGT